MTITFCAELDEPVGFVVTCGCDQVAEQAERHATYEPCAEAVRTLRDVPQGAPFPVLPGCERPDHCSYLGPTTSAVYGDAGPEVNVTGTSAGILLTTLGYLSPMPVDCFSDVVDARDFLRRARAAAAIAQHDGAAPITDTGDQPDVLKNRLIALCELGEWCVQRQRRIQWC